jgi:hypothetical protein
MSDFKNGGSKFDLIDPKTVEAFEEPKLRDIYAAIASYKGLPFPFGIFTLPDYKLKQWDYRMALINGDAKDMYGRPVIMPVQIDDVVLGSGKDDGGNITIQPLVTFEGKKKIVKNIPGGGTYPGTVKEFINFDDYKINIVGAVVNRNQKSYPINQVNILQELWKRNEALMFQCAITDDLFDYIVIEDIKFHELNKSPGIQMYEIKALSDAVIEGEWLSGDIAVPTISPGQEFTTDRFIL